MPRKLSDLNKRLAKVEQRAAHIARREKLANCNCYPDPLGIKMLVVKDAKEFEAQMNLSCPAHGFRRLGKLMVVTIVGEGGISEECTRREELATEYDRRLSEFLESHPELRDARDEF